MQVELSIMELNSLYMAVSKQVKVAQKEAKEYPSEFFENQLAVAEELEVKISDALWTACKMADEAIELVEESTDANLHYHMEKLEDLEFDLEVVKEERDYHARLGDWDAVKHLTDKIEMLEEDIQDTKKEIIYASTSK